MAVGAVVCILVGLESVASIMAYRNGSLMAPMKAESKAALFRGQLVLDPQLVDSEMATLYWMIVKKESQMAYLTLEMSVRMRVQLLVHQKGSLRPLDRPGRDYLMEFL
jgi:hypothetical protein